MNERQKSAENIIPMILELHPLVLEAGKNLADILQSEQGGAFLARLRKESALSLGMLPPMVKLRENVSLNPAGFIIKIREVMVQKGALRSVHSREMIFSILNEKLSSVIRQYAYEFLGPEEVKGLLDHLQVVQPGLVSSVSSLLTLQEIQRVLQNLLREGVPIRDLVKILEALVETSTHTHDPEILTEYVRHSMPRVVGGLYQNGFVIKAYVLEEKIEQWIAGGVRWDNQVYLDLPPHVGRKILRAFNKKFRAAKSSRKGVPILLVSPEIRRFVKMIVERAFPHVPVLSYNEISTEYQVRILGVIRLDPVRDFLRKCFPVSGKRGSGEIFPGDDLQKALLILNLLGTVSNTIGQYLTPFEREILGNRSQIAPVPTMGKKQVVEEFVSQFPPDKNVNNLEALSSLANREPFTIAAVLQRHWLSHLAGIEGETDQYGLEGEREETNVKERAAIFITSATRWIQDEVYRLLTLDELKELGASMLQFPFISPEGKRKAWEEYESLLYKDEWWDPESLAHFVRSSIGDTIDSFKKRGFRKTQKLAVLLLSLPKQVSEKIGNTVMSGLARQELQQLLGELGAWRDHLPVEARFSTLQEFFGHAVNTDMPDFQFAGARLQPEVERIIMRDAKGAAFIVRNIWLSPREPRSVFEDTALRFPARMANLLLSYLRENETAENFLPPQRAAFLVNSLPAELRETLERELNLKEKLKGAAVSAGALRKIYREFLRAYYGGNYPTPLPFLKRN